MYDITYYLGLITSQYRNSPKFLAFLRAKLKVWMDIAACAELIKYYYSLNPHLYADIAADTGESIEADTGLVLAASMQAEGVQLDVLGSIVGAKRRLNFDPGSGLSAVLDDDAYRLLVKAKIGINHWDGKVDSLQPLWATLFPRGRIVVQDNGNMTMTVILFGEFSDISISLITHGLIVPKPQGVRIYYLYGDMPFFGADRNDEYIAGPDVGYAV